MTAVKLGTWPALSPEWYAAREGRIGGSDIGAVMGWSPFTTRDALLQEKAGLSDPRNKTKAMSRGQYLEPAVLAWLADDAEVAYNTSYAGTWVDGENDWQAFNPDAVTTDGRLVEAKTTAVRDAEHGWGRAGGSKIPLGYAAQVQWGLGILGLDECLVAVLSGAPRFEFARYKLKFDPNAYTYLQEKARIFCAAVEALRATRKAA